MKYGLIGEKLSHSFSAEIHGRLFDYHYELKELSPDELADFICNQEFVGINVTIPYKEAVIPLLDEVDPVAKRIGAVNTVVNRNGKRIGYNTDYVGLKAMIEYAGLSLADKTVLILGSGGTSKTALAVAKDLGCREAKRVSRTKKDDCITYNQAKSQYAGAEILINTTPCGMFPKVCESAVNLADFPACEGVVDVVYNPLRTQLVCEALSQGVPAVGGLYMLIAQAARAAELFTGVSVPVEKIKTIYNDLIAKKQNIVLIGMPGCGKSTVGQELANQLGLSFVDTDDEISLSEGRSISEIFEAEGEVHFRQLEKTVIQSISSRQGSVIATGGGAILNPENIANLRKNGRIYFLDRPLEMLIPTADRPLSMDRDALNQRYQERYERYCRACDVRVDATVTVSEIIKQIREDLRV